MICVLNKYLKRTPKRKNQGHHLFTPSANSVPVKKSKTNVPKKLCNFFKCRAYVPRYVHVHTVIENIPQATQKILQSLINLQVCNTEPCISASARLFKTMNLTADPCTDFNEFACGRFLKEFNLPEDKSRWSSFTPIGETLV